MYLTPLVFLAALILEVLGSYISVVGLSSKSSLILMIIAVALDFSKIVIASVLYKNWKGLNFLFKAALLPSTIFLMMITSYGSYAFLLQEFGKTTAVQEQLKAELDGMEAEQAKLQNRKKEIDDQISQVSAQYVTQKKRLTEMFDKELTYLNERIIELDKKIPETRTSMMKDTTQAGTLGSLAKSWGTTPDQTAKIIALMMTIVIDPLAIVMIMVGNFLQEKYRLEKEQKKLDEENKEFELRKMQIVAQSNPVMPTVIPSSPPEIKEPIQNTKEEINSVEDIKNDTLIGTPSTPAMEVKKEEVIKSELPPSAEKIEVVKQEEKVEMEFPIIQEVQEIQPVKDEPVQITKEVVQPTVVAAVVPPEENKENNTSTKIEPEKDLFQTLEHSLIGKMSLKKRDIWEESAPIMMAPVIKQETKQEVPQVTMDEEGLDDLVNQLEENNLKTENVQIENEDPFHHHNSDLDDILREVEEHDKPPVLKKMTVLKTIQPFDAKAQKTLEEEEEQKEGFNTQDLLEERIFGN